MFRETWQIGYLCLVVYRLYRPLRLTKLVVRQRSLRKARTFGVKMRGDDVAARHFYVVGLSGKRLRASRLVLVVLRVGFWKVLVDILVRDKEDIGKSRAIRPTRKFMPRNSGVYHISVAVGRCVHQQAWSERTSSRYLRFRCNVSRPYYRRSGKDYRLRRRPVRHLSII